MEGCTESVRSGQSSVARRLLVSSPDLCGVKKAGAVMHGQKVDIVVSDPIDDAVAAD